MFVLHEGKSKHLSLFKNRRIVTKAGSQQKIRGLTRKQAAGASFWQAASGYPQTPCLSQTTKSQPSVSVSQLYFLPLWPAVHHFLHSLCPQPPPGTTNRPTIPQLGRVLTFPLSPSHLPWLSCPGPHSASNAGSLSLWSVRHR